MDCTRCIRPIHGGRKTLPFIEDEEKANLSLILSVAKKLVNVGMKVDLYIGKAVLALKIQRKQVTVEGSCAIPESAR